MTNRDKISAEIKDAIENSKIDQDTITKIIGYTGFSMLVCQNIPIILNILEEHLEKFNINIDKTKLSSIIIQTMGGILVLVYSILEQNSVIYLTIPAMILFNIVGLCIKLYFYIKEKREQTYY
jgi:uncharacterized protein YacL